MKEKNDKGLKEYSEIKEKQVELLDKVFMYSEYTFEKCLELGGLSVKDNKIVVKNKASGCEEPPIYEFFTEFDFENEE